VDPHTEEHTYREMIEDKLDSLNTKLDAVLVQTTATNGRVTRLEATTAVLQWGYGLAAVVGAAFGGAVTVAMVAWVFGRMFGQ
jgi:hypothetical protein